MYRKRNRGGAAVPSGESPPGAFTRNATDGEAAAAVSALENLIDTLGIPRRLSDWGVSEAYLALIAQDALEDLVAATNPAP